jgi:hypothetical protein
LNAEGYALMEGIEEGDCDVTFPDLDQAAWKKT